MSESVALTAAVLLLIGNAFFVGAEFAVISARRSQIEPLAADGSKAARFTLRAMEKVSLMLAAAQLGITMCSLGLGAIAEPAIAHLIEVPLDALGVPAAALHPIAFAIAMAIVVYLHMVLGEMVPKNLALARPERAVLLLAPPLYVIGRIFNPVLIVMNACGNLVLRMLRVEPRAEVASAFTADEVASFVEESREHGLLDNRAHELVSGALGMSALPVNAVVVPLDQLAVLEAPTTIADAEELCVRTGFSRFPVRDPEDGSLIGYVHLKDLLGLSDAERDRELDRGLIHPLTDLSAETTLDDALTSMQHAGSHMAVVTDSGRTVGVAMLEDVVERMIGDVFDGAQNGAG